MATRMSVGIRILALLLMGALASSVALAKKPVKPPVGPPEPPILYEVVWLNDPGTWVTQAVADACGGCGAYPDS